MAAAPVDWDKLERLKEAFSTELGLTSSAPLERTPRGYFHWAHEMIPHAYNAEPVGSSRTVERLQEIADLCRECIP